MPVYEIELEDGRKLEVDADREPTPQELQGVLGQMRPNQTFWGQRGLPSPDNRYVVGPDNEHLVPKVSTIGPSPEVETIPKQLGQAFEDINKPFIPLGQDISRTAMAKLPVSSQIFTGLKQTGRQAVESIESPMGLALMVLGPGLAKAGYTLVARAIAALFGAGMTAQTIHEILQPWKGLPPGEIVQRLANIGLTSAGALFGIKEALRPALLPKTNAALEKTKGEAHAIQVGSPEALPLAPSPGDSQTVGQGVPAPAETPAPQIQAQAPAPPGQQIHVSQELADLQDRLAAMISGRDRARGYAAKFAAEGNHAKAQEAVDVANQIEEQRDELQQRINALQQPESSGLAGTAGPSPSLQPSPERAPARPLTAAHQQMLGMAGKQVGRQISLADLQAKNSPQAEQIAGIDRAAGKVLVDPAKFPDWLEEDVKPSDRQKAVASLVGEEGIHLATNDKDADDYYRAMSAIERWAIGRIYTGGAGLDPRNIGYEAIRIRIQQLDRMSVRETLDRAAVEKWKVEALLVLNNIVRGIRERLGTAASKEQLAILAHVQENLAAAIGVVPHGTLARVRQGYVGQAPFARRAAKKEKTPEFILPPLRPGEQRPTAVELGAAPAPTITPADLRQSPDIYRPIEPGLYNKPFALGHFLTWAASNRTEKDSLSLTNNLLAMRDKKTGKTWVVSVYRSADGRAYAVEPGKFQTGSRRPNVPIDNLLDRYTPIAGLTKDKPVQNFAVAFHSQAEFNAKLGKPARDSRQKFAASAETAQARGMIAPGHYKGSAAAAELESKARKIEIEADDEEELESQASQAEMEAAAEEELESKARKTAREAAAAEEEHEHIPQVVRPLSYAELAPEDRGVLQRAAGPIVPEEARALLDYLRLLPGITLDSLVDRIKGLRYEANRRLISVFRKIALAADRRFRHLTDAQLLEAVAKEIYENNKNSKTAEEFVQRTIQQAGGRLYPQAFGRSAQAPPAGIAPAAGKELTIEPRPKPIPAAPLPPLVPPFRPIPSSFVTPFERVQHEAIAARQEAAAAEELARTMPPRPKSPLDYKMSKITPAPGAQTVVYRLPLETHLAQSKARRNSPLSPEEQTALLLHGKPETLQDLFQQALGHEPQVEEPLPGYHRPVDPITGQPIEKIKQSAQRPRTAPSPERQLELAGLGYRISGIDPITGLPIVEGQGPAARRFQNLRNQQDAIAKELSQWAYRRAMTAAIHTLADKSANLKAVETARAVSAITRAAQKDIPAGIAGSAKRRWIKAEAIELDKRLRSIPAAVATGAIDPAAGVWSPDKTKLANLRALVAQGQARARTWSYDGNPFRRLESRRYARHADELMAWIDEAERRWDEPEFKHGTMAYKTEMHNLIKYLGSEGYTAKELENYLPGLYEGYFWKNGFLDMIFMPRKLIGREFRQRKEFASPFHAIADGPYYLVDTNIAALAAHRILQGHSLVEKGLAMRALKEMMDRPTGKPIAREPVQIQATVTDPATGHMHIETKYKLPLGAKEYELVPNHGSGKPFVILSAYAPIVKTTWSTSWFQTASVLGMPAKYAVIASQGLKHGVVQMFDSFHPGRLYQYQVALTGVGAAKYSAGHAALSIRFGELDDAMRKGVISQHTAEWLKKPVAVKYWGRTLPMNNYTLMQEFLHQGLNARKNIDLIYSHAIESLPGYGPLYKKFLSPFNNWLFNNAIPGAMLETAVDRFKHYNSNPKFQEVHYRALMRDIAKDINVFAGNMGRQGVFADPTWRDAAGLMFLAPGWLEALLNKEIRFGARLTGLSRLLPGPLRRDPRLPALGALGGGMVRGLLIYFIGTQILNLLTRRQFTWQNPEEGHKMDAAIPWSGTTIFVSPLSVFAEVSGRLLNLLESKPGLNEVINQIGYDKLGPPGRMTMNFITGTDPLGRKYSTFPRRVAGSIAQVTPFFGAQPISIGPMTRAAAHALAPGTVSPNPPGRVARQLFASAGGIKADLASPVLAEMQHRASEFMRDSHLRKETGWIQQQTDEPSYAKLRTAIRHNDIPESEKQFNALLTQGRTENEIADAMEKYARRPLTGSNQGELLWVQSLGPKELEMYHAAMVKKNEEYQAFLAFFWQYRHPSAQ